MSRLPSVASDGNNWGSILNDFLSVTHNADGTLKNHDFNVKDSTYGAAVDGVTNDSAAIAAAVAAADAAGGGFVSIPGTCAISSPVTLSATHPVILRSTVGGGLKATAGFTGSQMVTITTGFCGVRDLTLTGGPSTTYSSNPATNGIQVTGAQHANIQNVFIQYVNGWGVQSTATAGQANNNLLCDNVHVYSSKQGFHSLGVTGSNFNGVQHFTKCNADAIGGGDCYLFEDIEDVIGSNLLGECTAGTGSSIHIKGACAGIYVTGLDIGPNPGPRGNIFLVESGANGSPKFIGLSNGIIEGGSNGVYIGAGEQIRISDCEIFNNDTGILLAGGDAILIHDCTFVYNGQTAGAGRYDLNSSTGGNVEITDCHFLTTQGSGAGQTNNVINSTAGSVIVQQCAFYGSGYTSANIFNNKPTVVRNCAGYNPVGGLTAPGIPSSTVNYTNAFSVDCMVYVSGGTVTAIAVDGTATGRTSGAFLVPANSTISMTYSVAPSWVWIAN